FMLRSSHDACGCSTQTTSTINLKRSTLHPHEGQADRPNTPSDSLKIREKFLAFSDWTDSVARRIQSGFLGEDDRKALTALALDARVAG
ncbi:MAG: hypothetical protein WA624_19695, partial [Methylocella sp.]